MTSSFYQDPPSLGNQYLEDRLLREYLRRHMPADVLDSVDADLVRFGQRVVSEVAPLGDTAERDPPRLVPYDAWGNRIDRIEVSPAWQTLERISAEEGLVAIGYERAQGEFSRLYQFAKLYLFNPSSAVYTCPLAMTDGAARLIEVHGDAALRAHAYRHLISRDPAQFWTSGQWMTERPGGSDVGRTETIARAAGDVYRLQGTKWFTSATTSQMAMTLARIEDAAGQTTAGSRGLSLFYLETCDRSGRLNQIEIHRLKDKLGTKALPTAELTLQGTPARLVGEPGRGVPTITTLVNVTRLYNAVCAVSSMRRGIALARDYASRREAFGRPLAQQPLHLETLADLELELHAGFHVVFSALALLGREECGLATPEESATLRLLTPMAKLFTAKQAVAVCSEILETFGGAGYVEDTGLPRLLRDTQVLSIWEGTTNVLSLDCLRAIERESALGPLLESIHQRLQAISCDELAPEVAEVSRALKQLQAYLPQVLEQGGEGVQAAARQFAYSLTRTYAAALLLEHAQWEITELGSGRAAAIARRWCRRGLTSLLIADRDWRAASESLALDTDLPLTAEPAREPLGGSVSR